MNALDIFCFAVLVVAAIRCAFRGLIKEIMSMAAIIMGILAAVFFSKAGAVLIDNYIGYSNWNQIVAFLAIFVIAYLIVKLLEGLLHRIFERIHLEKLDRTLGFFLGIIEGGIVVVLVIYLLRVQPLLDLTQLLEDSFVADLVLDIVPIFVPSASVSSQPGV